VEYYHPTFLYESLWNLGVFALVLWLFFWGLRHPNRLKTGTLFWSILLPTAWAAFGLRVCVSTA
jgi:prolipoprotein diacylglyceryltransferase